VPGELLHFAFMGFMGGVSRALLKAKAWRELGRYDVAKNIVLGIIGGVVYGNMVLAWQIPDTVVAFFFAYAFADIIDTLTAKILRIVGVGA